MAREVTIVDAGLGNLAGVERALIQVGAAVRISGDPDKVATSRMVVFPGQGAFGAITQAVVEGALGDALRMVIDRGDPFLGISMGLQLLFEGSDENRTQKGLEILPGRCRRFPDGLDEEAEPGAVSPAVPIIAVKPRSHFVPVAAPGFESPVDHSDLSSDSDVEDGSIGGGTATDDWAGDVSASDGSQVQAASVTLCVPAQDESASIQVLESPRVDTDNDLSSATDLHVVVVDRAIEVPTTIAPQTAEPEPPVVSGPTPAQEPLRRRVKVPHMGWNSVEPTGDHYYFCHSYYVEPARPEDVMWMCTHGGIRFPAAVRYQNVLGTQFQPEKSQRAGLRFLRAFILGGWG